MEQTEKTFKNKWEKNPGLAFRETLDRNSDVHRWILNRNGFRNAKALEKYLANKKRILDAGCGNGRVTALLRIFSKKETPVVGIDLAAAPVARKNLKNYPNIQVFKKNLLEDLSSLGKFDFIYCQEVLHHTGDPFLSFRNLCSLLSPGGEIAIYVYKKKAPVREFVDDFVRNRISGLKYDQAMKICRQITLLGKVLSEKKTNIKVPDIDLLGIKGGEYDLQRFIYHHIMKCFWNPEFSFNANVAINFDWYHPQLCTRHTPGEVRGWFAKAHLRVVQEHVDFYGITMRGKKTLKE
jgi:SAM-dependent methyltransferase